MPTADPGGGIGRDVGVHSDFRVEDAAVGVGIHLQGVQQLSVVLHPWGSTYYPPRVSALEYSLRNDKEPKSAVSPWTVVQTEYLYM